MTVQVCLVAPGSMYHQLSKANLRKKGVYLQGVLWETADFFCKDPKCGAVNMGYGNRVSNMEKELIALREANEVLRKGITE